VTEQVLGSPDQGAAPPGAEDPKDQSLTQEGDTFTRAQMDEALASQKVDLEVQINDVRSSLSKAQNIRQDAWDAERAQWQQRDAQQQRQIFDANVQGMDDDARAKFERDYFEQRTVELENRLASTDQKLAAALAMGEYAQNVGKAFGVKTEDLDMSSPENLSASSWEAATSEHQSVLKELGDVRKELEEVRGGKTEESSESETLPKAQKVVTQTTGKTTGNPTLLDLQKTIGQKRGLDHPITEEELFDMAERPEETGVDLNVVLQATYDEIATTK